MCGKFTAMASWAQVVAFSQPLTGAPGDGGDRSVTYRVMSNLPVIVWDGARRRVMPMRWGFPSPGDWKKPQPIHARAETIETTRAFADAFHNGQRGIVLVRTFNEAPDSGAQHTITPGDGAIGIAFVWRSFDVGLPMPLVACVMATVPANALIAALPTDRMPAILAAEDWARWLGEEAASVDGLKACLKTRESPGWTMRPEDRPRGKPTVRNPGGLF